MGCLLVIFVGILRAGPKIFGDGDVVGLLVGLLLLVFNEVRLTVTLTKVVAFWVVEVVSNRFEPQIVINNNIRKERCLVGGSLLARPNDGCKHIGSLLFPKAIVER